MPTIVYTPDAILAQANFSTAPTTANLSAQDASWAVASGNTANTDTRVSFSHPSSTVSGAFIRSGAGLQTFTVEARKNGGTGTPSITIAIFENGTQRAVSSAMNVTNTSSQTLNFTWNGSLLTDVTGAGVECRVLTTAAGGGPSVRASVDFGYIAWTADYDIDTTPPTITSSATFNVAENAAFSTTLTANEAVTWSKVGGADQALFALTGPTLSMTAKDFEVPVDADTNNTYLVTVRATDVVGNFTDQNITVTVTDVANPTITTSSSQSVISATALSVPLTVASGSPTWSLAGGVDQAQFEIVGGTLRWSANGTRSTASPQDNGANNVYDVIVRATVSGESTDKAIAVTVVNFAITSPATYSVNENEGGAFALTANAAATWTIDWPNGNGIFVVNGSTLYMHPQDTENPHADAPNFQVQIRATHAGGFNTQIVTVTVDDVISEDTIYPRKFYDAQQSYALVDHTQLTVASNGFISIDSNTVFPNKRLGDVLILTVTHANLSLPTPAGWTLIHKSTGQGTADSAGSIGVSAYYRVIQGDDRTSTVYFPGGGSTSVYATIRCYAGVSQIDDIVEIQASNATSLTPVSKTTAIDNSRWVLIAGMGATIASPTYPSGGGLGTPNTADIQNYASRSIVYSAPVPTAGAVAPSALSWTNAANAEAIQFVFRAGSNEPVITSANGGWGVAASSNSARSVSLTADRFVTWSVVGGADASHFHVYGNNLVLQPQDKFDPVDANLDNVYEVVIRATSHAGKNHADQIVSIGVMFGGATLGEIYARRWAPANYTHAIEWESVPSFVDNFTVTMPKNLRINDLLVLSVSTANRAVTTPVGWTAAHTQVGFGTTDTSASSRVAVFWRRVDGSEGTTIPITVSAGSSASVALIQAFANVAVSGNPMTVSSVQQQTTGQNTFTPPNVTTTELSRVMFVTAGINSSSNLHTFTDPSGTYGKSSARGANNTRFINAYSYEKFSSGTVSGFSIKNGSSGTIIGEGVAVTLIRRTPTEAPKFNQVQSGVDEGNTLHYYLGGTGVNSWSIVGGPDASKFEIVDGNALRWFNNSPRSANPATDADGDNVYTFTLRATNSVGFTERSVNWQLWDIMETTNTVLGPEPTVSLYTYDFSKYPHGTDLTATGNWKTQNTITTSSNGNLNYSSYDYADENPFVSDVHSIEITFNASDSGSASAYFLDNSGWYYYAIMVEPDGVIFERMGPIWGTGDDEFASYSYEFFPGTHTLTATPTIRVTTIDRSTQRDFYVRLNGTLISSFADVIENKKALLVERNGFYVSSFSSPITSLKTNTPWRPPAPPTGPTGWKSAAVATNIAGGNQNWVSYETGGALSNELSADDYNGTSGLAHTSNNVKTGQSSMTLRGRDFGFTDADIPTNATITGVEIRIRRFNLSGTNTDDTIKLAIHSAGTTADQIGSNQASATPWSNTEEAIIYGGDGQLWGTSLTPSQIYSPNFALDLKIANNSGSDARPGVDHVETRIFYVTESEPTTRRAGRPVMVF